MSLFKQFGTDAAKESEGIDVPFDANEDGSIPTFKIVRMGARNKAFLRAHAKFTKPYQSAIDTNRVDPDTLLKISINVFVEAALKGWSNVQDASGNAIPFNTDNAVKLFTTLPDLFYDLQRQSLSLAAFQSDETVEEAKN
ncbi:MAG: hypothetical protein WAN50_00295 [Minisyncoccia bacterium]